MKENKKIVNRGTSAIKADGLVKKFGGIKAVDGVSLNVPTGSIYAMLGPNGSGKTTIVNMLATLSNPDLGSVEIFGYDVLKEPQKVRQLIGLTGQFASIDESLTAMQNLTIFGRLLGFSRKEVKQKASKLLEEFSLTEASNREVSKFSGGMRRRLDLAASLLSNPPLIFLDEPTTGLDPRTRMEMWQTIRTLVNNGSTVLLTTQYLDEADQLADNIIVIDKGKVVANDTPHGLKKEVGSVSLQFTVKDSRKSTKAAQIVESILGTTAQVSEVAEITAPMNGIDQLTDVLTALKNAEIILTKVNVYEPSLDDVFFALTGKNGKEEN